MLRAFIDDSGSGGDSPWFVLAGYVGTAESWDTFDSPWRAVLDGPPKLTYFKSSEAESLRPDGQWAGVTQVDRNQCIDSLIGVISKHALRSIYVRLRQSDYDEVIKPYVPPMWRNAYYFLFVGFLVAGVSTEKYGGVGRHVEFFFDSNQEVEKPSRKLYGQIAALPEFAGMIEDIQYKDEKILLPLQAADLLAWQVRRRFSVVEPPRPQFERALNCAAQKPFTHTITRDHLEQLGEAMDQHAMQRWAAMGYPEQLRKWRRPKRNSI